MRNSIGYAGFLDCRIERDGTIHYPASSVYDPRGEMVYCLWTAVGYVPECKDRVPSWLILDEDGALVGSDEKENYS